MVGEIEDEYDFFPAYIRPFGHALVASATAKMADVFERLDLPIPANVAGNMTVENWVSTQLGHTPAKNEKIRKAPKDSADNSQTTLTSSR